MDYKFIKPDILESVSEGDPAIVREIVDIFRSQAGEIYEEMKILLADKKYDLLGFLAHKAKSSVAIMGIDDLATILKTFEIHARAGIETGKYESYINKFKTDVDAALIELEDLIINMSSSDDQNSGER
jgi:HPt (histidine-containing phosphotransfer) domain-containing protein